MSGLTSSRYSWLEVGNFVKRNIGTAAPAAEAHLDRAAVVQSPSVENFMLETQSIDFSCTPTRFWGQKLGEGVEGSVRGACGEI